MDTPAPSFEVFGRRICSQPTNVASDRDFSIEHFMGRIFGGLGGSEAHPDMVVEACY
jgi:hypothetical protein